MARIFLTSIAALFLATGIAHAIEYQGKLPKPVQRLPSYPPVVCVAPNWAVESCEDRQPRYWLAVLSDLFELLERLDRSWIGTATKSDQPRPWNGKWPDEARADDGGAAYAGKVVLQFEKGGLMNDYADRWRAVAAAGVNVEIRRRCISACTQIMEFVPKEKVCFDKHGTLEFHMARVKEQPAPDWTELWWSHQPENIRMWLREKGWVQKATIETF